MNMYKSFVIALLLNFVPAFGMSKEEIQNSIALWISKKICIQEIPFDETLLDGKAIIGDHYLKNKKINTAKIRVYSTLLFDRTGKYLQRTFSRHIESTQSDSYALGWDHSENYCSVIYDIQNLQKITSESLEFVMPAEYLKDHQIEETENFSEQCTMIIFDQSRSQARTYICFAKDKKTGKNLLGICNIFDTCNVFYDLSWSNKAIDMALNYDLTMIAAVLDDERIVVLSPIIFNNFSNFSSNYDVNFVFL